MLLACFFCLLSHKFQKNLAFQKNMYYHTFIKNNSFVRHQFAKHYIIRIMFTLYYGNGGIGLNRKYNENTGLTVQTERCILCGRDTGIPITKEIGLRKNYVVGCGQLCGVCFATLKHTSLFFDDFRGSIEE